MESTSSEAKRDSLISQSDFAKLKGWNRSTVTRLKQAGRVVMVDGLVDVEATEARLAETMGGRDDVAARHAAGRVEVSASQMVIIKPEEGKRK